MRGAKYREMGFVTLMLLVAFASIECFESSGNFSNQDIEVSYEAPKSIHFDPFQDSVVVSIDASLFTKLKDVLLVVDVTSSMNEKDIDWEGRKISRIDAVKRILNPSVMSVIDASSNVGLLTFGEDVTWVGFREKSEIILEIEDFEAEGIYSKGADALYQAVGKIRENSERRTVLILLTDGVSAEYGRGVHEYSEVEEFAVENEIEINTVLFGEGDSPGLARLSENTKGFSIVVRNNYEALSVAEKTKESYRRRLSDVVMSVIPLRGSIRDESGEKTWSLLERGTTQRMRAYVYYPRWEEEGEDEIAIVQVVYIAEGKRITETAEVTSSIELMCFWPTYKYHVVLILSAVILAVILAARYQFKKGKTIGKGKNVALEAFKAYESKEYRKALTLYTDANNTFRENNYTPGIVSTEKGINECKASIQELEEKKSLLRGFISQIKDLNSELKSLIGYDPPGRFYEVLFKMVPNIEGTLTGSLLQSVRNHIETDDVDEIDVDLLILDDKRKILDEVVELIQKEKSSYKNSKSALEDNLLQFGRLDKLMIQELCNVNERVSLLYLNFLIDDMAQEITFDRENYIELTSKRNLLFERILKDGIVPMEELVTSLNVSKQEILSLIRALREQKGITLMVDQEETLVYEPHILQRQIEEFLDKGQDYEAILKAKYGITTLPDDLRNLVSYRMDEMTPRIDIVCRYLEKDVPGIEKIENLRDMLNVTDEEVVTIINSLRECRGEDRYFVDWHTEKVLVDCVTLLNHIRERYKRGEDIADMVRETYAGCRIPKEIQGKIPRDIGVH